MQLAGLICNTVIYVSLIGAAAIIVSKAINVFDKK
jgi:hypothetical protein